MSGYGVSILALAIAFASMRGSLGLPSAVVAFSCAMERHGIIVVSASVLARAGHQDSGKSTGGVGGGRRSPRSASAGIV